MFFLRPFRLFFQALTVDASPHQMAFGLSLGVMVGLIPKGNLLAVALMMLLCSLRINLAIGMAAAFVSTWAGMFLDPLTHKLGELLLTHEPLRPLWAWMYDTSVWPWTNFNNTVVLGSFTLGLALFVPIYLASKPAFNRMTPQLSAWAKRFRLVSMLWGGELTGKLT